jgi:predicted aspartyl protease
MLEIIRNSRYVDTGVSYGWTYDTVYGQVRDALNIGNSNISSILEASRDIVQANIEKTMSGLFE